MAGNNLPPIFELKYLALNASCNLQPKLLFNLINENLAKMPVSSVAPATRLASELDASTEAATTSPTVSPTEQPLLIKLLSATAKVPLRGSAASAGLDLSASEDAVVPPRGKFLVKTGLQMRIPAGCYGRVAPRSGLALKKFIDVGAGVIDADYNGEVGVVMFNFSDQEFVVKTGDRIAQLIIERISMAPVVVVDNIEDTKRGAGGFGSTGII